MNDESPEKVRKAEWLLVLVAVIWASNYPVSKWGIAGLDIFVFNAIRFIVATVVVGVFLFSRSTWAPLTRNDWRLILRVGVIASVLYQTAFIVGLKLTTAGNAAVVLSTAPLWTVLLNARLHKEHVPPIVWVGTVTSIVGVVLIVLGSGKTMEFGSAAWIGDLVTLVAALFWAMNTNMQKPLVARFPAVQVTFVLMAIGAIGLSLIAIPPALNVQWMHIHWSYYLAAVVSGSLSIGAANVIWTYGVKRLGPGRTSNFQNLVPILAFIISYFTLDEQIHLMHIIGAAVTICGVWLARR